MSCSKKQLSKVAHRGLVGALRPTKAITVHSYISWLSSRAAEPEWPQGIATDKEEIPA